MGVFKNTVEQATVDNSRLNERLDTLNQNLETQSTDQGAKVEQVSAQVQSRHDAVDELKARLAKVSKQLDDLQGTVQNIQNPPNAQPGASPNTQQQSQAPQAPPADVLYNDALRDFNAGKNDLALQEFK